LFFIFPKKLTQSRWPPPRPRLFFGNQPFHDPPTVQVALLEPCAFCHVRFTHPPPPRIFFCFFVFRVFPFSMCLSRSILFFRFFPDPPCYSVWFLRLCPLQKNFFTLVPFPAAVVSRRSLCSDLPTGLSNGGQSRNKVLSNPALRFTVPLSLPAHITRLECFTLHDSSFLTMWPAHPFPVRRRLAGFSCVFFLVRRQGRFYLPLSPPSSATTSPTNVLCGDIWCFCVLFCQSFCFCHTGLDFWAILICQNGVFVPIILVDE